MTRILVLIFMLHFSFASAQKEMTFDVFHKPETRYHQTIDQTSEMNLRYMGSEEFLQKLKENGLQNPTVTNSTSKIETIAQTGKLSDKNNFPITIEFIKLTNSDGKKPIPDGTFLYGNVTAGHMPKLDSIVSKDLDESFKKTLLELFESSFSKLSFPIKKMKVGDSFSNESPLSIPISGVTVKMIITTTYTLTGISNSKGNLDVNIKYLMESNYSKFDITATGKGKGIMIYDIEKKFISKYEINNEMEMLFKTEQFNMEVKSNTGFTQNVTISSIK